MQATNMQFTLDEDQWEQDWASVLSLASQPGASLEQTHVFALAHIIRRPIIIYGVKFVRSFRGETLGLARFQGRMCLPGKSFHSYTQGMGRPYLQMRGWVVGMSELTHALGDGEEGMGVPDLHMRGWGNGCK